MKLKIKEGTASKIVYLFIQDSTSTSGAGLTGLSHATSGIQAHYIREGGSATQIGTTGNLAAGVGPYPPLGSYFSGLLREVSSVGMPGVYEFGVPNAVIAAGAGSVVLMLHGAANMVPVLIEIELDKIDYRSSSYAKLEASASTIVQGNPVAGTLSFTEMTTDLTETTDDHYNGRVLIFTSGVLAGQATDITDYDGASKKLTFTALSDQPATGGQLTSFVIV